MKISLWIVLLTGLLLARAPAAGEPQHEDHEHEHEHEALHLAPAVLKEFGIELATAARGRLALTRHLSGEVVAAPDRLYHVVPQVAGIVRQVFKEVGDRAEAGEPLAQLSSRELAQARAELLIAKSRLDLANANLARERQLYRKGITSRREFLQTQQAQIAAAVALDAARHRLQALGLTRAEIDRLLENHQEVDLSRYLLRAPATGQVIEKHAALGEFLRSDRSAFVLADLSRVWVLLTVYQKDLPDVRPGQPVRIGAEGFEPAEGTIDYVSPVLDEATRTAQARVILDNPGRLWRPGMFVGAEVTVAEVEGLVVPAEAVVAIEMQPMVFVREDDRFEPRPVRLGRRNPWQVEILSGLRPGETYVARHAFLLKAELGKGEMDAGHHH
ncbi:membrane fusion protein, heavy metal efflux system [Methylomarinovum tepidoasis]|uniref:Membrane fusion protein, heavy metal efflux system n=1 Tax=Methylomarinovum tepidoasis TaxID=2840183 RepID=A0AAU9CC05_9GAMM|nr:efflux RND transporter periplasmic adaptor subunit [Methylomarinovum sp. IN45]BCX88276.1 membrane fusion protein, heavy metal efflux system [Methylomarinovum sp. IN45]